MQLSRLILPVVLAVLAAVSGCSSKMLADAAAPAQMATRSTPAPSAAKRVYPTHPVQTAIKSVTLQALKDPRPSFALSDSDSLLLLLAILHPVA